MLLKVLILFNTKSNNVKNVDRSLFLSELLSYILTVIPSITPPSKKCLLPTLPPATHKDNANDEGNRKCLFLVFIKYFNRITSALLKSAYLLR